MATQDIRLVLLNDLIQLHDDAEFELVDIDDQVLKAVITSFESSEKNERELYRLRAELWKKYASVVIKNLFELATDLSNRFVDIKKTKRAMNKADRKLNMLSKDIETNPQEASEKIIQIFYNLIEEWINLSDSIDELTNEAWRNFFIKTYLPFATLVSAFFIGLLFVYKDELKLNIMYAIFIWLTVLAITYLVILRLAKRFLPSYAEKEIEE